MKPANVAGLCLVACAAICGCSEDSRPPPLGRNGYTCDCTCDRCVRRDPATGACIEVARDTRPDAICSDVACGVASGDPMARCQEKCERIGDNCSITVTDCVDGFCTGASADPLIAGGEPTSAVLALIPAASRAALSVSGEHASTALSGQIRMTGGECPGSSCPLRFDYLRMTAADFEIDGHPITSCQAINDGGFTTTVNPDGTFLVPSGGAAFFFRFVLDGALSGLRLANDGPMTGRIDLAANTLTLSASGSAEDASVDLFITAGFTNRPPTAAAGPDLTIECTGPHSGVVSLDASGTTDPDGLADIAVYGWLEGFDTAGELPLGSGATFTTELPLGAHTITLLVGDQAGARDTDEVSVSVVDTQPPVVISAQSDPACIWPPDHRYVQFRVGEELQVTALDACDPSPPAITIVSAVSNQPGGGAADDALFDATTACLRAERAGADVDRVYTVTLAASDTNGYTTLVPVEIVVPHDVSEHPECAVSASDPHDADEDAACRRLAATRNTGRQGAADEAAPAGTSRRAAGGCSAGGGQGLGGLSLTLLAGAAAALAALARRRRARVGAHLPITRGSNPGEGGRR